MALLLLANAVAFHETRRTNHAVDTGKEGREEGRKEGRIRIRIRARKAKFIFSRAFPLSFSPSLLPIIHFVLLLRREPAMPCIAF